MKRVQESAVLRCACRLLHKSPVSSGHSSRQQKISSNRNLHEPKVSSIPDSGAIALLQLNADVLPRPPPPSNDIFKRRTLGPGQLRAAPSVASTESPAIGLARSPKSRASAASAFATLLPSMEMQPPPPPPSSSFGFKRKASNLLLRGDSVARGLPSTVPQGTPLFIGREMVGNTSVQEPVQLHGLLHKLENPKEYVVSSPEKNSFLSSNDFFHHSGIGNLKNHTHLTCSVRSAADRIRNLHSHVSPHLGCSISKLDHPWVHKVKTCFVSKPSWQVMQVVGNEDQLCKRSTNLSQETFGINWSSNPPPDYSSLEEGPAALNPPLLKDFPLHSAENKLKTAGKVIVCPDVQHISLNISRSRPFNAPRAWSAGKQFELRKERAFHRSHVQRPSPDDAWLQPLASNSNAPGDYLPRRLFGFPLEWTRGIPRTLPLVGAQTSSKRSRVMTGLSRGLLSPIQESEEIDIPYQGTAYADALVIRPQSTGVTKCKMQLPSLYSPSMVVFAYLLTIIWTALCVWATYETVPINYKTIGHSWVLSSIIGVVHEFLVHQSLRAAATAVVIGAAVQKSIHIAKKSKQAILY
jgi:hypothetical protein